MTAEGPPPQSTTDEGADEPGEDSGEDPAIVYWVSLDGRVTRAKVSDEHVTHIEHDPAGWYFWCEAQDCYARGGSRYQTATEVETVAAEHEAHPG